MRINLSRDLQMKGSYAVNLHFKSQGKLSDAVTPPLAIQPEDVAALPRRVGDAAGNAGDMVNFVLLGPGPRITEAFASAGWVPVDRSNRAAVVHGLEETLNKKPYVEMPMSTLYLFGRPQDLSYARANPLAVAASRHHLRLWDTGRTLNGNEMWAGAATHDIGFARDDRNDLVTHRIDPDVDLERDFVMATLRAAGDVTTAAYVTPGVPLREASTATGEAFHSDGRIAVMLLR